MVCARQLQPGERPLDIEMAFGDPDAMKKAAAVMALHENCRKKGMHCPWVEICRMDPSFICPIDIDERSRINENAKEEQDGNS